MRKHFMYKWGKIYMKYCSVKKKTSFREEYIVCDYLCKKGGERTCIRLFYLSIIYLSTYLSIYLSIFFF